MSNGHRWIFAALASWALSLAPSARAQTADGILSRHVREADGTSGQDTNSGAGVKTGHLQNGAVTAAKLAPAAVGAAALAAGAVTDAKIAGPISASKIDRVGLDADTVDGLHAAAFRRKHARVVVVASDGSGDFTDPAAAVASIQDATEAAPYLVKVLPGVYTLGAAVELKPFVDLEGSGRGVTRLQRAGGGPVRPFPGGEIRDLTLQATGAACVVEAPAASGAEIRLSRLAVLGSATGVYQVSGVCAAYAPYRLDDVELSVTSDQFTWGILATSAGLVTVRSSRIAVVSASFAGAIWNISSAGLELDGSLLSAQGLETRGIGWGNSSARSSVRVRNSTVTSGRYGLLLENADAWVEGSTIDAPQLAIHAAVGTDLRVAGTRVNGPLYNPSWSPATVACFGTYTPELQPYTCQ